MLQLCRRLPITLLERPTLQIHTDTCFLSLGGPKPWVIWMIWCRSHFQNLTWGQRAEESARLLGRTSSKRSTLWWRAPLARCKHCPSLKSYERESAGWPTERGFKKNRGVRIFQNILSLYRVYIYIHNGCMYNGWIYIYSEYLVKGKYPNFWRPESHGPQLLPTLIPLCFRPANEIASPVWTWALWHIYLVLCPPQWTLSKENTPTIDIDN